MSILAIGGTRFFGRALVERGARRGHEVTVFHRGESEPDDLASVELLADVLAAYKKPPEHGCLIVGEKGIIYTNPWNASAVIKLSGDEKLRDVLRHEPTKEVPATLPRGVGHMEEWVKACKGEGKTWSDFDFGGHLTEIGLTGVLAVRVGHDFAWDAQKLKADAAGAERFVRTEYRRAWVI